MQTPENPKSGLETQARPRQPLNRRLSFWVIVLFIIIGLGYLTHSRTANKNTAGRTGQPAPVVVKAATTSNVPVYINALGSVTPTYNVTVRTTLNGILTKVLFTEGQLVKKGDLLATIDSRPYEAQLLQYQGQLERDQALLANAQIDLKRYQTLWKQDSISQQQLATQESLVKQLEGSVLTDQGLIAATKVSLIYTNIISPVDGRIGLRFVDAGNFVQTSDTNGIAVVNTLDPITVIFTIPETKIPEVREKIYAGQTFEVQAYNQEQTKLLATGKLITIDNQIDPNTGTVKLKAEFNNAHYTLFPSQFVNIKLLIKILSNAVVIPTSAIQYTPTGNYVYVLNTNQTVSMKPVDVGITTGEITTINSGLSTGERVVVEGTDALTDKAKVKVVDNNPADGDSHAANYKRRSFA